jgi:hypothetical protein
LYFAEKLRRFGASVNSAEATLAADTKRAAGTGKATPSGAAGKGVGRRSGITIRSFACAPKFKLQAVECRTLVGTKGNGRSIRNKRNVVQLMIRAWEPHRR